MLPDKFGEMSPLRHVSSVGDGFKCGLRASPLTLESAPSAPPQGGNKRSWFSNCFPTSMNVH